jgi:hypothetical protein
LIGFIGTAEQAAEKYISDEGSAAGAEARRCI